MRHEDTTRTPHTAAPAVLRRRTWVGAAALVAGAAVLGIGAQAHAQDFPSRAINLVVGFPPGGSNDIVARILAPRLGELLGVPVVVVNKPGSNALIGTDFVARSAPDGYTITLASASPLVISPNTYSKMPFDPVKDLTGITSVAATPELIAVHPSVPANTLQELVALSKTTDINFAVTAVGSAPHVAGVAVERATGAKWTYVPYKGGSQAVTDTVAGQTQVIMNGMLATLPHVQSGRLKVLGISKKTRMPLVGDVPTLAEQGVTDFESGTWQGALVANGTPAAIIARLNAELIKAIRSPDVRARLTGQGAEVVTMQSAEQDRFFESERKRWGAVVAQANIKLD